MCKTMMFLILFIIFNVDLSTAVRRKVDCSNTDYTPNPELLSLYDWSFQNFSENKLRNGVDSLRFEALALLASVGSQGADLGEFLVALKQIEQSVASESLTLSRVFAEWRRVFLVYAEAAASEALVAERMYDETGAFLAHQRASTFYVATTRYGSQVSEDALALYANATAHFNRSLKLAVPVSPWSRLCSRQTIPLSATESMDGIFCYAANVYDGRISENGKLHAPLIIQFTGYDGDAIFTLREAGHLAATSYNMSVLIIDGPGQGGTVRKNQRMTFRPDWEVPVGAAIDFALSKPEWMVDRKKIAVWGRSFGGYLAARAYAGEPRLSAAIVDGGIADFYQMFVCQMPAAIRDLYYKDVPQIDEKINEGLAQAANHTIFMNFLLAFARLGFGTKTFTELLDATSPYTMAGHIDAINSTKPILVIAPQVETLTGNQSALFWEQLPRPLHKRTQLLPLSAKSGSGLHCAVGSTTVEQVKILQWLKALLV